MSFKRLLRFIQSPKSRTHVRECAGFVYLISQFAPERYGFWIIFNRFATFAQIAVENCNLVQCRGLASEVISLSPDRKSTRLNSSHGYISYAVFCLKKKK